MILYKMILYRTMLRGRYMPMKYDKLWDLIEKRGLSQYKLLKSKTISATTMQKLREGKSVTTESISRLCSILDCQPGDIMEYVPGEE